MGIVAIDDGYDFRVLVLDGTWVVRVPRRPGVVEALRTEVAVLPRLAAALPVRVPEFEWAGEFVVYRLIEGEPLVDEDPREFLAALHGFDPDGLPVPAPDWAAAYAEQVEEFRRVVLPLLDLDERPRAEALFAEVDTLTGFERVLVHADLGPAHLLCRDGRLAGVIDWGDMRIGDPALDYAWLLNGPFPRWDVEEDLRRRAGVYHRLGPWYEAHYGVFTHRDAHVRRGLDGIRERL